MPMDNAWSGTPTSPHLDRALLARAPLAEGLLGRCSGAARASRNIHPASELPSVATRVQVGVSGDASPASRPPRRGELHPATTTEHAGRPDQGSREFRGCRRFDVRMRGGAGPRAPRWTTAACPWTTLGAAHPRRSGPTRGADQGATPPPAPPSRRKRAAARSAAQEVGVGGRRRRGPTAASTSGASALERWPPLSAPSASTSLRSSRAALLPC